MHGHQRPAGNRGFFGFGGPRNMHAAGSKPGGFRRSPVGMVRGAAAYIDSAVRGFAEEAKGKGTHAIRGMQKGNMGEINYRIQEAERGIRSQNADIRTKAVETLCEYRQEASLREILEAVMKGGSEKQVDRMLHALGGFWAETGSEHVLQAIGAIAVNEGNRFSITTQKKANEWLKRIEDTVARQAVG